MKINKKFPYLLIVSFLCILIINCSKKDSELEPQNQAYLSTYKPDTSETILIRNARVLTGSGDELDNASILMENNKITAIGEIPLDTDAKVIDVKGKWITPGIIDIHSHMGVYPSPGLRSNSDGNEATSPVIPMFGRSILFGHMILNSLLH
jgi:hypothetical protein